MHIAVIMDGNRRYGLQRYGSALRGHRDGASAARRLISWCSGRPCQESGRRLSQYISDLSLYAFSTHNWARDEGEVECIMQLFLDYANEILSESRADEHPKIKIISTDTSRIPAKVLDAIHQLEERTASNAGLRVNLFLSYSSQDDMARACQLVHAKIDSGELQVRDVTADTVRAALSTPNSPPPDILIRTSGESRISDFMLFEIAFTELFFLDVYWPLITFDHLETVLSEFATRSRRYGA